MIVDLLKHLFFIGEFIDDFSIPLHRKYFYKYIAKYLISLFWVIKSGYPSRKLKLIGITGTDGKTTTANLLYAILNEAGIKTSIISTIYGKVGGSVFDTGFHVTTPDIWDLQRYFQKAADEGSEYFIIETTSHGLDQYRLLGCYYEIGILTNVTREHLDYHKTFVNYFLAKLKLLKNSQKVVINVDDNVSKDLMSRVSAEKITYGIKQPADVSLKTLPVETYLPGEYNKYNILACIAAAKSLGIEDKVIQKAIKSFKQLSGRMEEIKNQKGITVVVDFAHTPNSLEQALQALRQKAKGKLISVFGAASQRDEGKRPIMGAISAKLADITILTDEDPRFEDSMKIIDEIAAGATAHGARLNSSLFKQADRAEAIKLAISMAKKGDVIGIFGKGHENSMNYKGKELPWSDQEAAAEALKTAK